MENQENSLEIEEFLNKHIGKSYDLESLQSDASSRRYTRVKHDSGTYMFMDASKELASVKPFVQIAEFLLKFEYSAPKIIAKDEEKGFVLLEDFGVDTYTQVLRFNKEKQFEHNLYKKAIEILIRLHKTPIDIELPIYSKEMLVNEALLLVDWYLGTIHEESLASSLRDEYIAIWNKILDSLNYKYSSLVLRDYHIDNLMWLEDRVGIQKVGLLDFQDAVLGSCAYDVVSLLEDARYDVPSNIVQDMLAYYFESMASVDRKKFMADYAILGTQRSCKIVGIFARKAIRDNDSRYLKFLPRTWSYIRNNMNNPILEPLKNWFLKIDLPSIKAE